MSTHRDARSADTDAVTSELAAEDLPTPVADEAARDPEQSLFFHCLDDTEAARAERLAAAPAALADRVRRLLRLHAQAEEKQLADDLRPAEQSWIGPYRRLTTLGEGGMGTVYLAQQESPVRRLVAVKLLRMGLESPALLARFRLEQQTLAVMNHPGISRLLDAGESGGGLPYLVMDYVDGEALTSYCRRQQTPLRQRLELFVQLCDAVAHAHQKGVVHRDLKPGNVLVVQDQTAGKAAARPVVIDFGVAKVIAGEPALVGMETQHGTWIGTPDYMAPEQAKGDPRLIDVRTDVWALGAILYELLTGTTPHQFHARGVRLSEVERELDERDPPAPSQRLRQLAQIPDEATAETLEATAAGQAHNAAGAPASPSADPAPAPSGQPQVGNAADLQARRCGLGRGRQLQRALEGELDWVVRRALERDPARRYASASALAADIERVLADEAVAARPPSFLYLAGKLARRHAGISLTAVGLLLALLTGALLVSLHARELAAERARTAAEAARASEVTEFVSQLFEGANARRSSGALSAREMLDEAAERLSEQPAQDPRTQIELLLTTGRLYTSLGLFEPSLELLADAVALSLQIGDRKVEAAARSRHGLTLSFHGQHEAAIAELEAALAILPELTDLDADERAYTRLSHFQASQSAGKSAGLAAIDDILGEMERAGLGGSVRYACALVHRGRLQRAAGDLAGAESTLYRSLALLNEDQPLVHVCQAGARSSLTLLLQDLWRWNDAESIARQVLETHLKQLGEEHPDTLVAKNNLGLILRQQERHDEAHLLLDEAASGLAQAYPADHPAVLQVTMNRELAAADTGLLDDPIGALQALLDRALATLPDTHPLLGVLRHHMAGYALAAGDTASALEWATQASEGLRTQTGPTALRTLQARARKIEVMQRADLDYASELTELLADADATLGAEHPESVRFRALAELPDAPSPRRE